jgi:hypothetical protein
MNESVCLLPGNLYKFAFQTAALMKRNILVVYYTQTGQLHEIVKSVTALLQEDSLIRVVYEELKPKPPFPFPWSSDEFFQSMPESVKGIPCELEPLSLNGNENFDLIIVAWQPWYLSPSIPIHAFFQNETAIKVLKGKPVVTVIGSRNMWVMAQEKIKEYISKAGGNLVGNILLYDKAPNLLSVVSVIRWMFQGKKDRYMKIIPPAGVSWEDIAGARRYGDIIRDAVRAGDYGKLREQLVEAGAVDVKPELVMIEKRGIILFRIWAAFILKKGQYGSSSRINRVRLFKYYLLFVIYFVSPFATILYHIIRPFRRQAIKKQISFIQS